MITKTLAIVDEGTFIPVMATKMTPANSAEHRLLDRAGYGSPYNLVRLEDLRKGYGTYNAFDWGESRTWHLAHLYIIKNFDNLVSGDHVDVMEIINSDEKLKAKFG